MIATLLLRGLAAGLVAGLLAGAFAFGFGEPHVERAIAIEESAAGHGHEAQAAPLVSRDGQRVGLVLATAVYGMALGGLFALAFAVVRGRTDERGDWSLAVRLAGLLFLAVALVPALKYPANPPAVGAAETIGARTALYLTLLAISLLALLAAWRVVRQLPRRLAPWSRQLAGAGVFVVTIAAAFAALPAAEPVPAGYPADLLWSFRVSALGVQLVLWAGLGALFGLASEVRSDGARRSRETGEFAAVTAALPDDR
jgi:hypothetical protein